MAIIAGDCGGIVFREGSGGKLYLFEVCQDSNYKLYLYVDYTGSSARVLSHGSSSAISTGANQSNTIAVLASGSTIELFVNQQRIDSVNDTSYSEGSIGLVASAKNNQTEVAYTNARAWTF